MFDRCPRGAMGDTMTNHRDADRRVRKTRTQLSDALASLVHEKPYDEIVVKEILARADVGRSTFYTHYRDKDELLERCLGDLLRIDVPLSAASGRTAGERLLAFSLPFLEHVERFRARNEPPWDAMGAAQVHEHLRRVLESLLEDRLRVERRLPSSEAFPVPTALLAQHIAASFVLTLDWWRENSTLSAQDVDRYFRALVAPLMRAPHLRSREP
jgi:AcrR family transcriptional regulator